MNKKHIVLIAALVLIAITAIIIGLAVGLTRRSDDDDVYPLPPSSDKELFRVNCVPEAEGGVIAVTQELCKARGCVYEPSSRSYGAPSCFLPQDDSIGYRVVSGPEKTTLGERWFLERKNSWGIYAENFQYITFDVENRGNDIFRFKVYKFYNS